jgi:hypothetical protein
MTPLILALTAITGGPASRIDQPRHVVVRTGAEWQALWQQHAPGRPAPRVDFGADMVVGIFLGTRPSAGYTVEIVAATADDSGVKVEYREGRPGKGMMAAMILTAPFHLVRLAARDGAVGFVRVGEGAEARQDHD